MSGKEIDCSRIRNFCIVAHIDHGKSTLADRLLEYTGTVTKRDMQEQLLDDMDLERERGITIKARAVAMQFEHKGVTYELNLIDTPGHVDFQYEVSRSLTCCEGALLLADAFQGVEAQTVANGYNAIEHDLTIIPVINKIDLKTERADEVSEEMSQTLGVDDEDIVRVSAKSGINIEQLIEAIITRIPPPDGNKDDLLQAMVFDSHYDEIPRRDYLCSCYERSCQKRQQDPVSPRRFDSRSPGDWTVSPQANTCRRASCRPSRLHHL